MSIFFNPPRREQITVVTGNVGSILGLRSIVERTKTGNARMIFSIIMSVTSLIWYELTILPSMRVFVACSSEPSFFVAGRITRNEHINDKSSEKTTRDGWSEIKKHDGCMHNQ